jgi:hypothetical protein
MQKVQDQLAVLVIDLNAPAQCPQGSIDGPAQGAFRVRLIAVLLAT